MRAMRALRVLRIVCRLLRGGLAAAARGCLGGCRGRLFDCVCAGRLGGRLALCAGLAGSLGASRTAAGLTAGLAPGLFPGGCVRVGCRGGRRSVGCRRIGDRRGLLVQADLGRAENVTGAAPQSVGLLLCRTAGGTAAGIGAAAGLFRLCGGVRCGGPLRGVPVRRIVIGILVHTVSFPVEVPNSRAPLNIQQAARIVGAAGSRVRKQHARRAFILR